MKIGDKVLAIDDVAMLRLGLATVAMHGMIVADANIRVDVFEPPLLAKNAFAAADAMLAELQRTTS